LPNSATIAPRTSPSSTRPPWQPGITINGAYSNPGKDKSIFLRNGANSFTVILLDGQPLLDPSSLGGAVDLRLLSLDGVERVEILRGARSLLYGSDAVAGVINLVSKKGDQASPKPSLHLRAAAQNYGTFDAGIALAGSGKIVDYNLGYDFFNTTGISEAKPMPGTNDLFQKDGARRQTIRGGLTFRVNEYLSLSPSIRLAAFDGDYDAGSFQDADNTYRNDLMLGNFVLDYNRKKFTIGARFNASRTQRDFDSSFGESSFIGDNNQNEIFATFHPQETTFVTVGAQHRRERISSSTPDLEDPTATTYSPYLQLGMRVAKDLLFEAGYRYNNHSNFGGQSNFSLALGVQTTKAWSSRLSIASAFQSPTLDQLAGPFGPNPDLQHLPAPSAPTPIYNPRWPLP